MELASFTSEVHLFFICSGYLLIKTFLYSAKQNSKYCKCNTEGDWFSLTFSLGGTLILIFSWDFFLFHTSFQMKLTSGLLPEHHVFWFQWSKFNFNSWFIEWFQAYFHKSNLVINSQSQVCCLWNETVTTDYLFCCYFLVNWFTRVSYCQGKGEEDGVWKEQVQTLFLYYSLGTIVIIWLGENSFCWSSSRNYHYNDITNDDPQGERKLLWAFRFYFLLLTYY